MRRVVKIGGSLLVRPDLVVTMNAWLTRQTPAQTLVIVGGGQMIDAIRTLDRVHGLDEQAVHWMCVDLLRATFDVAAELFSDWVAIDSADDLRGYLRTGELHPPALVLPGVFYHRNCPHRAPANWQTTTDTIAALLAFETDADEVVLLKSCDVPTTMPPTEMSRRGIIDEAFAGLAHTTYRLRVEKLGGP